MGEIRRILIFLRKGVVGRENIWNKGTEGRGQLLTLLILIEWRTRQEEGKFKTLHRRPSLPWKIRLFHKKLVFVLKGHG